MIMIAIVKSVPGDGGPVDVYVDGDLLDPKHSQELRNHSPDGFNVGYGGSGPAQCALGILLHVVKDKRVAMRHYQDFKWQFTSKWQANNIYYVDIESWINSQEKV